MQTDEAERMRKEWADKPCKHPKLEKEYYLGSATGDYVCTTCGEARGGRDWNKTVEISAGLIKQVRTYLHHRANLHQDSTAADLLKSLEHDAS